MNIREKIENWIKETLELDKVGLMHPKDLKNGDYSFFATPELLAKVSGQEEAVKILNENKIPEIEEIKIAGNFINFYLSKEFFANSVKEILSSGEKVGQNDLYKQEKILIEHTQPNPFKPFHIGHLMNNAIGESISRILKRNDAKIETASYHGDKGLHVAKWVWATRKGIDYENAYAYGNRAFEDDENVKQEIINLNKIIYEGKVADIWEICKAGFEKFKKDFKSMCKKLDSDFTYQFWETAAGEEGKKIVENHIEDGIFEKSENAVVFRGEKYGLHTRVFINSEGLPTYEAKELGLAFIKNSFEHFDKSITITGNEQNSFFDVTEVAIGEIFPDLKGKLLHLSHGMLKLPSGKMSSRTGDVITAENLIEQVKEKVQEKIKDPTPLEATSGRSRNFSDSEKEELAEMVAIGAIKYSILRQAIGGDIIFDFDKSISFEGDSGPYLQYTAVRAHSVLEKAKNLTPGPSPRLGEGGGELNLSDLERYLYRFEEVVERAGMEYAPHYIVTYLTELSAMFNSFYAREKIIDAEDPNSPYKIGLTEATFNVLKAGLKLLAIKVPERM